MSSKSNFLTYKAHISGNIYRMRIPPVVFMEPVSIGFVIWMGLLRVFLIWFASHNFRVHQKLEMLQKVLFAEMFARELSKSVQKTTWPLAVQSNRRSRFGRWTFFFFRNSNFSEWNSHTLVVGIVQLTLLKEFSTKKGDWLYTVLAQRIILLPLAFKCSHAANGFAFGTMINPPGPSK